MKRSENYRGIVILESLIGGTVPPAVVPFVVQMYPYLLDGWNPKTIVRLEVPARRILAVAQTVANALLPRKYFAQFTGESEIIVTFPRKVMHVVKGETDLAEQSRNVGSSFGIPRHQMQFEKMFEQDHPTIHKEESK